MSRNSSTFSSEHYLRWFAGWLAILFGTGLALGILAVHTPLGDFTFARLQAYQIAKAEALKGADIVLVGDSSLGNGIDAALLSRLTGLRAVNLALTGAYGLGGTENMLRRALRHSQPALVVIMQTHDTMANPPSPDGFLRTAIEPADFLRLSPIDLLGGYANLDLALSVLRHAFNPAPMAANWLDGDYVRQGDRPTAGERLERALHHRLGPPAPQNRNQLERLAQLCRSANTICVFAHGPWLDTLCARGANALAATNAMVRAAGLKLADERPLCLPADEMGDTDDHVRPGGKAHATTYYLKLLRRWLPKGVNP